MAMTNAEKQKNYRDRVRGGPPKGLAPHGTRGAALRHQRAEEPMCEACGAVWAAHQSAQYLKRQHRAGKASATAVLKAERAVRRMEREARSQTEPAS